MNAYLVVGTKKQEFAKYFDAENKEEAMKKAAKHFFENNGFNREWIEDRPEYIVDDKIRKVNSNDMFEHVLGSLTDSLSVEELNLLTNNGKRKIK